MFDYSNLSPSEFEILCADILSRELNANLRHFSPGRDGGVDLADSPVNKTIVVQIKHYSNSSYSSLKTSLIKELDKLKTMKPTPKKYYVCTSQLLPHERINEIYTLFSDYMESDEHIFTKAELDKFLNTERNSDILRKNFKLWLVADKILTQLVTRDVFIDGEVLLDNLEEEFKYFVQTRIFDRCIEILERDQKLLICGDPGVGKSINSKMLALYFVKKGYKIRYTTNGMISDLKKSLQDNKDLKEVLFLDDCLGQYYLKLREWQDKELISLMKYIDISENKVLILNSRVTVLNQAQVQSRELRQYLEDDKVSIQMINMNDISLKEKAVIFYNHLLKNQVPNEYYNSIRRNKGYKDIVGHNNYNPRIIEYVTHKRRYARVEALNYKSHIIDMLNNPEEAWKEEFKEGLGIEDRIFMHTLFSLTDTLIEINKMEDCFVNRIRSEANLDHTVNKFQEAKLRLTSSLVRVIDDGKGIKVGVLNPSINDYMKHSINANPVEKDNILKSSVYVEQIEKIFEDDAKSKIRELLINGGILDKKSLDNKIGVYIITAIANGKIKRSEYRDYINEGFNLIMSDTVLFDEKISKYNLLKELLKDKDIFSFYAVEDLLDESDFAESIFWNIGITELIEILKILESESLNSTNVFWSLLDEFVPKYEEYLYGIDLYEYVEEYIEEVLETYYESSKKGDYSEFDNTVYELEIITRDLLLTEITNLMIGLKKYNIYNELQENLLKKINEKIENELQEIINGVTNPEPDDDYPDYEREDYYDSIDNYNLDLILDRDMGE